MRDPIYTMVVDARKRHIFTDRETAKYVCAELNEGNEVLEFYIACDWKKVEYNGYLANEATYMIVIELVSSSGVVGYIGAKNAKK